MATLVALSALAACLTDPPPDLPLDSQPPTIDHSAIFPPDPLITALPPNGFEVTVNLPDPTQLCQWSVYDQDPVDTGNGDYITCRQCDTTAIQNGKITLTFSLTEGEFDPSECHYIVFTVGGTFADQQCHSGGSDTTAWDYRPAFASCVSYDAGTLGDGAFPEAGADGLPITPDDAGDEP